MTESVAVVEDLRVTTGRHAVPLVDGVGFAVGRGEVVGIVGESGSGKTLTALSLLGLLPDTLDITATRLEISGVPLLGARQRDWRRVRGRRVAMIHQDPNTSLNPARSIGSLMSEVAVRSAPASRSGTRRRILDGLARVGLPHPERIMRSRSYELSGGMRQRVAIATALLGEPDLLLADEPTTALDATLQAQVLDLLVGLAAERGTGLVLITHDLSIAARSCDRVIVMYAGSVAESGPRGEVLTRPRHHYTKALLAAAPRLEGPARRRLASIPGVIPAPAQRPAGCVFAPRCPAATPACATRPSLVARPPAAFACWHPIEDRS